MSEELKKTFFGGYEKKNTERMLVTLSNKLASTQSEIAQQRIQTEKVQNDTKVQLANYAAEIEVKTKIINQLRQRIDEQERQIQYLNRTLEERPKAEPVSSYNNSSLNRVGEVYALAYDSAYKMASEAQDSAVGLVETVYDKMTQTENEYNDIKNSTNQAKLFVAQRLNEISSQILLIQEKFDQLVNDEADFTAANKQLSDLKNRTITKIGNELQQYAIKNKNFRASANPAAVQTAPAPAAYPAANSVPQQPEIPADFYTREASYQAPPAAPSRPEPQAPVTPVNTYKEPSDNFYSTLSYTQKADPEQARYSRTYPNSDPAPVSQTEQPSSFNTAENNGEYTNKKSVSVKDLLKKYSNI